MGRGRRVLAAALSPAVTGARDDWRSRLGSMPLHPLPGGLTLHEASTRRDRWRGLAGLGELPADRALHLRPCRAVDTLGMRFALDLVWLDRAATLCGSTVMGAGRQRVRKLIGRRCAPDPQICCSALAILRSVDGEIFIQAPFF